MSLQQFPYRQWSTLPSEVWSHILNHLPAADIHRLLLGTSGLVVPADSTNTVITALNLHRASHLAHMCRFPKAAMDVTIRPGAWKTLPIGAWNNVLDCLRVPEVDRLVLSTSGQVVPDDAVNVTAKVVNLVKPSCFATANRFLGAELVRIPCLAEYQSTIDHDQKTNKDVAEKIVPLVAQMKRLEDLYVGAKRSGEWHPPDKSDLAMFGREYCCWTSGDGEGSDVASFKLLVGGFVDCFRDGKLSSIKKLHLLRDVHPHLCGGTHRNGCKLCDGILRYFPLSLDLLGMSCCYSLRKKAKIFLSRPDRGGDVLKSKEFVSHLLERRRTLWESSDTGYEQYNDEGNLFWQPPSAIAEVVDLKEKDLGLLEYLVCKNIGFDPKSLSIEEVEEALGCHSSDDDTGFFFWLMKSSYERLVAIGFQFDIKSGTLRSWNGEDDVEVQPGMHIQPDNTFDRDTEFDCCRVDQCFVELALDSSDDEEDERRKMIECSLPNV